MGNIEEEPSLSDSNNGYQKDAQRDTINSEDENYCSILTADQPV